MHFPKFHNELLAARARAILAQIRVRILTKHQFLFCHVISSNKTKKVHTKKLRLARAILLPTQDALSTSLENALKEVGANILVKAPESFAKYNWPFNLSPKFLQKCNIDSKLCYHRCCEARVIAGQIEHHSSASRRPYCRRKTHAMPISAAAFRGCSETTACSRGTGLLKN